MKKTLLLVCASMLALASSAQMEVSKSLNNRETMKAVAIEAGMAPVTACTNRVERLIPANKVARKSPADGLWYQRPEGSLWVRGSEVGYTFLPAFTDLIWQNKATNKESTTWSIVTPSGVYEQDANEDNDYNVMYGNGGYYVPTINSGDKSFNIGDILDEDGNEIVANVAYTTDTLYWSLQHVNAAAGMWYGFSDGAVFGTMERQLKMEDGSTITGRVDAIHEVFNKPPRPLYISSFFFYVVSEVEDFLPEGKEMKLVVRKRGEEDVLGETIAEMPFTLNDTIYVDDIPSGSWAKKMGAFEVKQIEKDAFGSDVQIPIIVEDAFVISIEGFEQENVNFSLYMVDVMQTSIDFYETTGNVVPTLRSYINKETGEKLDGMGFCQYIDSEMSAQYNKEDGTNIDWTRQYNASIMLNAMYDVAYIEEDHREMVAPVEGGIIETKAEFLEDEEDPDSGYHDNVIRVYSTLPWFSTWEGMEGAENYFVVNANDEEEAPDWIEINGISDNYFESYDMNIVQLTAAALPEDVEGRKAELRIISDMGASSEVITITQGKVEEAVQGDVNNDGTVDVADISAIISVMAGTAEYSNADVNGDGTVDVADISAVISVMAGK